ncbi:MAG: hypothetical protein ABFS86_11140 [Planctomycetota bacterium]
MDSFRRGTLIAALVLSAIVIAAVPLATAEELGTGPAAGLAALMLVAIWGSRLGANALYRGIFAQGQVDERGKDSDFI